MRVPQACNSQVPDVALKSAGLGRVSQVSPTQVPTSDWRGGSEVGMALGCHHQGGLEGARPRQFEGRRDSVRPSHQSGAGSSSRHGSGVLAGGSTR